MSKRRKNRRNPIAELTHGQEFELILWGSKEPERRGKDGPGLNFTDTLQKRAAYFLHREYLLEEAFGNRNNNPGRRSAGWWLYEAKEERPEGDQWERLIELGAMDEVETAAVLADWTRGLELFKGMFIANLYRKWLSSIAAAGRSAMG